MRFAGIDRCRSGWVVAIASGDRPIELSVAPRIEPVIEHLVDCDAVAIDIPIALVSTGRRTAESEVRAVLGASARSVFTSPTRTAIEAPTQAEATEWNRAQGGPGISAQAFGLFASIREVRQALSDPGGDHQHWWETHPETSFALMNDGTPLASKRTGLGVAQRLTALRRHYPDLDAVLLTAPAKIPIDDILDAIAAAWSAQRIAFGAATTFGPVERDDQGFALGIRV